ncbi:hypothetical protein ACHAWF_018272 [Thalassiosira exigua]
MAPLLWTQLDPFRNEEPFPTAGPSLFASDYPQGLHAMLWTRTIVALAICFNAELVVGLLRGRDTGGQGSAYHRTSAAELCSSVVAVALRPDKSQPSQHSMGHSGERDHGMEFMCETAGTLVPIQGSESQMNEMDSLLERGLLVSGDSTVEATLSASGNKALLPPGGITVTKKGGKERRGRSEGIRNLGDHEGVRYVLVARVTDSDGRVHPDTAEMMSDNIFGTFGDSVTLKSQLAACSNEKFVVSNEYPEHLNISKHLSAPGVIDISIGIPLLTSDRVSIIKAMAAALQSKLGFEQDINQPGGPLDHVLFVLEDCYVSTHEQCGWEAYAMINSWLTVYKSDFYKYPTVQMHELGHNLNLVSCQVISDCEGQVETWRSNFNTFFQGHSGGLDGEIYSDHTCPMGRPPHGDDIGVMCYNPAKTYQLSKTKSWYDENVIDTWDSDISGHAILKIIGIADYNNNPNGLPVVVKIESGGPNDLFLGFNRAMGINKDTSEARDKVTIIEAGNDGLGYSQSFLKATLSQGETHRVPNWRGTGLAMEIHVREINLDATPAYADVMMDFGKCGDKYCGANEDSILCPSDCVDHTLETTYEYDSGSNGNMFHLQALNDITITSLDINTMTRGTGAVKVYARMGRYWGHEQSIEEWDMIFSSTIHMNGRGRPTRLGLEPFKLARRQYYSFYVWAESKVVYKRGFMESLMEQLPFAYDASLIIFEGIGVKGHFGSTVYSPRVWSGGINYMTSPASR